MTRPSDPRGRVCRAPADTDAPCSSIPCRETRPFRNRRPGAEAHRVPGQWRTDTSRKIPVRPLQRCRKAVGATSTVGLASGPPGGRRAASTLDRATPLVCHTGRDPRQSSRREYPGRDAGQTGAPLTAGGAGAGRAVRHCDVAARELLPELSRTGRGDLASHVAPEDDPLQGQAEHGRRVQPQRFVSKIRKDAPLRKPSISAVGGLVSQPTPSRSDWAWDRS